MGASRAEIPPSGLLTLGFEPINLLAMESNTPTTLVASSAMNCGRSRVS